MAGEFGKCIRFQGNSQSKAGFGPKMRRRLILNQKAAATLFGCVSGAARLWVFAGSVTAQPLLLAYRHVPDPQPRK
jgi:hypothetical protein